MANPSSASITSSKSKENTNHENQVSLNMMNTENTENKVNTSTKGSDQDKYLRDLDQNLEDIEKDLINEDESTTPTSDRGNSNRSSNNSKSVNQAEEDDVPDIFKSSGDSKS